MEWNPQVECYGSGFGPPRVSGWGFQTGLELNRPVCADQTRTAGGLPGPIGNARLSQFCLSFKGEKCQFGVSEVSFLGFVLTWDWIGMQSDGIGTIEHWPTPTSFRDVQVLLGSSNSYWRFIRKYAKVMLPLTELLRMTEIIWIRKAPRKAPRKPNKPLQKWELPREAELAFLMPMKAFTDAPMLLHFDPAKLIIFQTDASGLVSANILHQYNGFGTLRPVNLRSRECSAAEKH